MDDKQIISNWITRQKGFSVIGTFMTGSDLKCPICKKNVSGKVITKRSGFCMPCFIHQIVMACKKVV